MPKEIINPGWERYHKITHNPAVKKGNLLVTSGQGSVDHWGPTTKLVLGDMVTQARQIYENIKATLEAAGLSFNDVVKTIDYITPPGLPDYRPTGQIRQEYFKESFPGATGIIVNQLLIEGLNLEVDVWAITNGAPKEIIDPGWARYQKLTYRPAVKKGEWLFFSGQGALDMATGMFVGKGDIVAQTRKIYENLRIILETAGASFDDIVKIIDFIAPAGLKDYSASAEVRREYFKNGFPAVTAVVVENLLREEMLIEIDAIAITGKAKKEIINPNWPDYDKLACSPGVKKGKVIFVSGQGGVNPITNEIVGKDDVVAQTRQAYENIKAILEAGGATLADVVKTVDYLAPGGLNGYRDTRDIRREYLHDGFPTGTGPIFNRHIREELLNVIDVVAVID